MAVHEKDNFEEATVKAKVARKRQRRQESKRSCRW